MNRAVLYLAAAFSIVSTAAFAECTSPNTVAIPDGKTASYDDMVAAQGAVRAYLAEMEEYLACLNEEIEAQNEETPEEARVLMIERYNAAVAEMENAGARFNEQLGAYRAANPSQ